MPDPLDAAMRGEGLTDEQIAAAKHRPAITTLHKLRRALVMVDAEIHRNMTANPWPARWWEWRRKAWLRGVEDAHAVSLDHLNDIKAMLDA